MQPCALNTPTGLAGGEGAEHRARDDYILARLDLSPWQHPWDHRLDRCPVLYKGLQATWITAPIKYIQYLPYNPSQLKSRPSTFVGLSMSPNLHWPIMPINLLPLFLSKLKFQRLEQLIQPLCTSNPHDRSRHPFGPKGPSERNLGHGDITFLGDTFDGIDDCLIGFGISAAVFDSACSSGCRIHLGVWPA
jgi:hypothetical protein